MAKNYKPFYHKNREHDSIQLGDALGKMFEHLGLDDKLQSASIVSIWKETMGKFIAERTKKVWLTEHTLHISLVSAPLKKEMQLNQQNIMNLVNEQLGKKKVTELRIY